MADRSAKNGLQVGSLTKAVFRKTIKGWTAGATDELLPAAGRAPSRPRRFRTADDVTREQHRRRRLARVLATAGVSAVVICVVAWQTGVLGPSFSPQPANPGIADIAIADPHAATSATPATPATPPNKKAAASPKPAQPDAPAPGTPKTASELTPKQAELASLGDPELEEWRGRLRDHRAAIGRYPEGRFTHRGIVFSAGGRMYFTSVYVTIRVLRDVHGCTLPIEVFYCGEDELPQSAIAHMTQQYAVRFVDVTAHPEAKGVHLKGYQLKAFTIYLSSFEEVLWLDSDNIPLRDPSFLFDTPLYASTGALFWKDFCNMVSFRPETFGVFGLAAPAAQPQPRPNKTTIWPQTCADGVTTELETGQVLINKRASWAAMQMIVFLNRHHWFFLKRLFQGDKMTFHFGFEAAGQEYATVPFHPKGVGIRGGNGKGDAEWFCGNTMAQRSPEDGSLLFMHRTMSKYKDAGVFTRKEGVTEAWKWVASQPARSNWMLWYRDELPSTFFMGTTSGDQYECVHPDGPATTYEPIERPIQALEQRCLHFLSDLENLPFYPKNRRCTPESMFFCKHP